MYVYLSDIDVDASTANITVEVQVRNEYNNSRSLDINLRFWTRETLSSIAAASAVSNLYLWSWSHVYFYDVRTILSSNRAELDNFTTCTSFRKTVFSNGMFQVNDRALHLKR